MTRLATLYLLDESYSMWHLRDDVIKKHKDYTSKNVCSRNSSWRSKYIMFNTKLFFGKSPMFGFSMDEVLDDRNYWPGGQSALFAAVNYTLENIEKLIYPTYKDEIVHIVIATDGIDNRSTVSTLADCQDSIKLCEKKFGIKFFYLLAKPEEWRKIKEGEEDYESDVKDRVYEVDLMKEEVKFDLMKEEDKVDE